MFVTLFLSALCVSTTDALATRAPPGAQIGTSTGSVQGKASSWKSGVSEYLGIPYAQPPVGELRWAAPKPAKLFNGLINATTFVRIVSSSTQLLQTFPRIDVFSSCAESASRLNKNNPNAPQNTGAAENEQREDCLTLNIWTKPQTGEAKKAVLIWIHGGAFLVGSSANQPYNGALLAEENDVVVASLNYRLSALGFPGVGLPDKNLGLLDMRLAIEWLRDNVEKFGGDAKRMTLFGQSAGGGAVDYYSYAYTKDPILAGLIPMSGTAGAAPGASNVGNTASAVNNWSTLSVKLGCGRVTAADVGKTLGCMRSKSTEEVMQATLPKDSREARIWQPDYDGKTLFADTAARRARGDFIQVPVLVGNVDNELATQGGVPGSEDNKVQNCPSDVTANYRRKAGVPVWRYLYSGQFPDQNLGPAFAGVQGAWHGAELAELFGTTELKNRRTGEKSTANELVLAAKLREVWSAFAKDPVHGLDKLGWPQYDNTKPTVAVLGGNDNADITFESPVTLDSQCALMEALGSI
ncbi:alpha/beta-hydrolase [Aulographum hederae CBS 113979]|uniref:Carboxylic ester hydrolase n=1 Tax=Aulographum hederae CBS 113979 TaxID=1176131 RepID=A0A6G1GVN0_9PEZI|nr:alpha/beta-hydrolase [Aulographum hederae CBS 113979]